jgi:hypothetical protein
MKKFYSCCKAISVVLVTLLSVANVQATCYTDINKVVIYNIGSGATTTLSNGATISASSLPANWNIEAVIDGSPVGSVKFIFSGDYSSSIVENTAPFRTPTDAAALNLPAGSYTLVVKLYKDDNAGGWVCDEKTICFTITGSCSNVTNAGTIGYDESKCGPYDPANIQSLTLPTGGSGTIEYVWWKKVGSGSWEVISGATGSSYDPPTITQTTTFKRKARRSGCTDYIYSNFITKTVTSGITVSCTSSNGTCTNGGGSVSVSCTNGTGLSYLWSNGATTSSISNLAAGTYTVTVTSSSGCTATCSKTVTGPACCNVTNAGTIGYDETKCGPYDPANIQSITLATGGTGTIEYVWWQKVGSGSWTIISGATGASYDPPTSTRTTTFKS